MDIVKATREDMLDIMHLFSECIKDMQAHGIDQWDESYPTRDIIAGDIQNQSLYMIQNEEGCLAVVTIDEKESPEYKDVKWSCEDGKNLCVHRLAVHPKWHRRKIATKLMDFAERFAKENDYTCIRFDVFGGNPRGIKFYESCGYKRVGQVYFREKRLPFFCYEKVFIKKDF